MHLLASGMKIHFIENGPKHLDGRRPNGFAKQRHQEKIDFKAHCRQWLHDLHDEPRTHPLPTPGFVVFAARFSLFIIGAAIPWPQIATEHIGRLVDSDVPECHLRQISHSRPSIKEA